MADQTSMLPADGSQSGLIGGGALVSSSPVGSSGLSVQVCGRLLSIPAESAHSLVLINRHLTQQLKLNGSSSLQLADVAGKPLVSEGELAAALREGRHPLQASMTVSVLREIEIRKSEVETKKEELAQFQWQVIVDQMQAVSQQATAVAASLQGVKDECQEMMQRARAEEKFRAERMEEAITREAQQREGGLREVEARLDRMSQVIVEERAARDVATHQLQAQLEAAIASLEADRNLRAQEHAEMRRFCEDTKHRVETAQARNEEQWNWHAEMAKRLDGRLEERAGADMQQQARLGEVESSAERMRATMASFESSLASTRRTMEDLMSRRQEELSKAVRDEMLGRENHIARMTKELEASWQGLEAKLARCREEASAGTAGVTERVRVLERRCAEVEKDVTDHMAIKGESHQALVDRVLSAANAVDAVEVGLKSSDVITKTTASRVEELFERLVAVEQDCKTKVTADFWQPQMSALQRADQRMETKMAQFEKDVFARLSAETTQRDGMKAQLQQSLKSAMDKMMPENSSQETGRFGGEASPKGPSDGLVTPRCSYATSDAGSPVARSMGRAGSPIRVLKPALPMPALAGAYPIYGAGAGGTPRSSLPGSPTVRLAPRQ